MSAHIEILGPGAGGLVPLDAGRLEIGTAPSNHVVVADDTVSRMHAVIERLAAGWCVRDLTSTNGTFVNGERVITDRPLRHGDEIRVGGTLLRFFDTAGSSGPVTRRAGRGPELTRREREVLVELCRPLLTGGVFRRPATIKSIAERLVISEAGVRQHLARIAAKFGVDETSESRRVELANRALSSGAISIGDLSGD